MKSLLGASCALVVGLGLVACKPSTPPASEPEAAMPTPSRQAELLQWESEIDALLQDMTLDEKVGQMTQADMSFLAADEDVAKYFLGSVLHGGNTDPKEGNSAEAWRATYDRLQAVSSTTRLKIPLIYGVDAVHGHSNVEGAVIFPHNIGLGATRDAELVEEVYRATALEVRATGIHWSFAPCVAVARDERWGRTYESFGEDPELAALLGVAATRGLQGASLSDPGSVVACVKHFAGDGGTTYGTGAPKEAVPDSVFEGADGRPAPALDRWPLDRGDTRLDEAELRRLHMAGYVTAIHEGAATIMPSFSSWNGVKASASHRLLTEILKEELGFEGFLISDWAAIDEIPGDYASDIVTSVNAGMDMVMVPDRYQEFFTTLKRVVEEERVPMARVDDAVRRILRVKFAMGLLGSDRSPLSDPARLADLGSAEHRELARRAVQKSLVLLRNEDSLLPLEKSLGRIHVVGKNADDLGNQCGGWTISWQGASGKTTEGTTVLEAIRAAVAEGTEVTYARDGSGGEGADVVVAVLGEAPYAEMLGDREDLSLDAEDVATIERAAASGVPVLTLLISGRPMILGDVTERSRALIAAWLPGTEGQGVADVLFGDAAPSGKLGFSWPRSNDQLPINVGDAPYDPLFPYGFGLTY